LTPSPNHLILRVQMGSQTSLLKQATNFTALIRALSGVFILYFVIQWVMIDPSLHFENLVRTPFYALSRGQGFWGEFTKIFDVCRIDACLDRFRPLGMLTELLDAKAMVILNRWMPFYFRPLSQLILILTLALSLRWALIGFLGRAREPIATFFAASFLVTPQVLVYSTFYFRPGKLYAAISAALLLGLWWRGRSVSLLSRGTYPWKWITGLALLTLADEQVSLVTGIIFAMAFVDRILRRRRSHALASDMPIKGIASPVLITCLGGLALYLILRSALTPYIYSHFVSGPITAFSNPLGWFRWNPNNLIRAFHSTFWIYESMVGNKPDVSVLSVIGFVAVLIPLLWIPRARIRPEPEVPYSALLVGYLAIVLVIFLMATRHPFIYSFDVKRTGYYFVSFTVILFEIFLLTLFNRGVFESQARTRILIAAWTILSLVNMCSLHKTLEITYSNHMNAGVETGRILIREARGQPLTELQASLPPISGSPEFRDFFHSKLAKPGRWAP